MPVLTTAGLIVLGSISTGAASPDLPALPRAVIEAGLAKAGCTVPRNEAQVVGNEWLGPALQIVEVRCWRSGDQAGSILFAIPVPSGPPQLIMMEDWRNGRVVPGYSVASPTYDPATRTLGSAQPASGAGDCGPAKEWKWTGWFFRLTYVKGKGVCDAPDDDGIYAWQVQPGRR